MIDARVWLAENRGTAPRFKMYGLDAFDDLPHLGDYDPWEHADVINLPLIARPTLPRPGMIACYSHRLRCVFFLPHQSRDVERCAIAHEIVHYEYGDIGTTRRQEDRADRVASRRLVRPSRLRAAHRITDDHARLALELGVTERIMRAYERNHHGQATAPA